MEQYGVLGVSLATVSVCVVEADGRVVAEGVTGREAGAIAAFLAARAPRLARLGLETGPFTVGLAHGLRRLGLPVEVRRTHSEHRSGADRPREALALWRWWRLRPVRSASGRP